METTIIKIHESGFGFTLADGSKWILKKPEDASFTASWSPYSKITILEDNGSFSFVNIDVIEVIPIALDYNFWAKEEGIN